MKPTGSIDLTAAGRHRVRVTYAGRRTTVGVYDSPEQAEAARVYALETLREEEFTKEQGVTLAKYGEQVLTQRELRESVSDPQSDRGRWKKHVLPDAIAKMPLRKIRSTHVEDFLARVVAKGLEHQTMKNVLNVLRVVFKAAKRARLVSASPCLGLVLPAKPAETVEKWTYLLPDEQAALLARAEAPERHAIAFAVGTGLRAGELVSLRAADVHLDGLEPHVVVRYGKPPSKPTKGKKIRRVPLFGVALDAARAWAEQLAAFAPVNPARGARKLRGGRVVQPPTQRLFFPDVEGHFRSEHEVLLREVWKALPASAGIARNVRWHDLRHTCGSSLVSGWWGRRWSLEEVKELLGHSDISVTQRYAHLGETALKAAALATVGPRNDDPPCFPPPRGPRGVFEDRARHQAGLRFQPAESFRNPPPSTGASWPVVANRLEAAVLADDADAAWGAARELALGVLGAAGTAAEVLAGGPHAIARALDLADAVLRLDVAVPEARRREA